MSWQQITFNTTTGQSTFLEAGLEELGACSITLKDSMDQPIFEPAPGETPLWDNIELTALFPGELNSAKIIQWLNDKGVDESAVTVEIIENENWQEKWVANLDAICFGQRLWVCPTLISPPQPDAVNIILDPGLAFGSGTHPTTALCLEWLDQNDLAGKNLIDYGCGSGILAIAAAKLGAKTVWALDNDPQALMSCKMNAEQNDVADQINIISPDEYPKTTKMDIVIANILVNPLIELKSRFLFLGHQQTQIVMSGILASQINLVTSAYKADLKNIQSLTKGDWSLVSGKVITTKT